jgi:hypothetical protein
MKRFRTRRTARSPNKMRAKVEVSIGRPCGERGQEVFGALSGQREEDASGGQRAVALWKPQ